jgi:hypothetical protein
LVNGYAHDAAMAAWRASARAATGEDRAEDLRAGPHAALVNPTQTVQESARFETPTTGAHSEGRRHHPALQRRAAAASLS